MASRSKKSVCFSMLYSGSPDHFDPTSESVDLKFVSQTADQMLFAFNQFSSHFLDPAPIF